MQQSPLIDCNLLADRQRDVGRKAFLLSECNGIGGAACRGHDNGDRSQDETVPVREAREHFLSLLPLFSSFVSKNPRGLEAVPWAMP
jgi:hypothetical protein